MFSADVYRLSGLGISYDGTGKGACIGRRHPGGGLSSAGGRDRPVFPVYAKAGESDPAFPVCRCDPAHALPYPGIRRPFPGGGPDLWPCHECMLRLDRRILSVPPASGSRGCGQGQDSGDRIRRGHRDHLDAVSRGKGGPPKSRRLHGDLPVSHGHYISDGTDQAFLFWNGCGKEECGPEAADPRRYVMEAFPDPRRAAGPSFQHRQQQRIRISVGRSEQGHQPGIFPPLLRCRTGDRRICK